MYALYHGDEFIDIGTQEYLAKLLGVTKKTISFYATPTYRKRIKDNAWIVIRIEED